MSSDPGNDPQNTDSELRLLPEQALLTTSAVDHADWNYRPILGRIQRLRFDLIRSMLRGSHASRLLEIGYGSGVFLPELAKYGDELHGVDPHPFADDVSKILSQHDVHAKLVTGSATQTPYETGFFQAVVAVSALEFIDDLEGTCREVKRILAPDGIFVVVTPAHSPLVDLGVRVITGASPRDDFKNRRTGILPCLFRQFVVGRRADFPPVAHGVRLYTALRLSVPAESSAPKWP